MPRRDPDALFASRKPARAVPFAFVLDELADLGPWTRPMFGCTAVYVEEKIVFVLREKGPGQDDGVWIATVRERHESLRRELPSLQSIAVLGPGVTGWQMLPAGELGFEEEVLRACAMVRGGDPRIGKVPKGKGRKAAKGGKARRPAKGRSRPIKRS